MLRLVLPYRNEGRSGISYAYLETPPSRIQARHSLVKEDVCSLQYRIREQTELQVCF